MNRLYESNLRHREVFDLVCALRYQISECATLLGQDLRQGNGLETFMVYWEGTHSVGVFAPEYRVILQSRVDVIFVPLQDQRRGLRSDTLQGCAADIVNVRAVRPRETIDDAEEPHVAEGSYNIRRRVEAGVATWVSHDSIDGQQ